MTTYTETTIDAPLSDDSTFLLGINDAGQIIGWYNTSTNYYGQTSFIYSDGAFTLLDDPVALGGLTLPVEINNVGEVAGNGALVPDSLSAAPIFTFVYQAGNYATIQTPP